MAAGSQPETDNGGPPYEPDVWQYGGKPKIVPDVIICAIYLLCYVVAAVIHKVVFLTNKKKGQKFVMSAMTFGFCFVRLITFSTRLAWGVRPQNSSLALVSNIFLNAGIPILYIINLVFAHRITRAQHPRLGWHRSLSILGRTIIGLIVATLIMLIYSGVQSAYTQNPSLHRKMRDIQIYGSTFNSIVAVLPLPILLVGVFIPKRVRTEKFGSGRFRVKIAVLVASSLLLTLRAIWGTATAWLNPVPLSQPMPWYFQKAIFYTVQLLTELIVVYMFIFVRINRIFYTPDGHPRGSYVDLPKSTTQLVPPPYAEQGLPTATTLRVYSEEELFEDENALANILHFSSTSLLLDNASGKWKLERQSISDAYTPSTHEPSGRASTRGSTGSNYYFNPVTASTETSRAPSLYTPSTWNKERYNKEKDRRDSAKSGYSSSSTLWSGPSQGKEVELQKHNHDKPAGEVTEIQSPLPRSDVKPVKEQLQGAEGTAREVWQEKMLASFGTGSSFQERVDRLMRDSQSVSSHNRANTTRIRSPRSRPLSPPRTSSAAPPPIPEVYVSTPERAVSQPPRSPIARQSF